MERVQKISRTSFNKAFNKGGPLIEVLCATASSSRRSILHVPSLLVQGKKKTLIFFFIGKLPADRQTRSVMIDLSSSGSGARFLDSEHLHTTIPKTSISKNVSFSYDGR